jgi:hypothetical protein
VREGRKKRWKEEEREEGKWVTHVLTPSVLLLSLSLSLCLSLCVLSLLCINCIRINAV